MVPSVFLTLLQPATLRPMSLGLHLLHSAQSWAHGSSIRAWWQQEALDFSFGIVGLGFQTGCEYTPRETYICTPCALKPRPQHCLPWVPRVSVFRTVPLLPLTVLCSLPKGQCPGPGCPGTSSTEQPCSAETQRSQLPSAYAVPVSRLGVPSVYPSGGLCRCPRHVQATPGHYAQIDCTLCDVTLHPGRPGGSNGAD